MFVPVMPTTPLVNGLAGNLGRHLASNPNSTGDSNPGWSGNRADPNGGRESNSLPGSLSFMRIVQANVMPTSLGDPLGHIGRQQQRRGALEHAFGAVAGNDLNRAHSHCLDSGGTESFGDDIDLSALVAINDAPRREMLAIVKE